ncbi:hypothetical protein HDV00_002838 [Rhizophlyctis rosea]|nr:hypothetical protein HDV00_002838 [Rhizophlyctis rosea]
MKEDLVAIHTAIQESEYPFLQLDAYISISVAAWMRNIVEREVDLARQVADEMQLDQWGFCLGCIYLMESGFESSFRTYTPNPPDQREAFEDMWLTCLERRKRLLGADHPETMRCINALAGAYTFKNIYSRIASMQDHRDGKAKGIYVHYLEARRSEGLDERITFYVTARLAELYLEQEKWELAEGASKESLQLGRQLWGNYEPNVLTCMNAWGSRMTMDESGSLLRKYLLDLYRQLGRDNGEILLVMLRLGRIYQPREMWSKAETLWKDGLELLRPLGDDRDPITLTCMHHLAEADIQMQKSEEARTLLVGCLAGRRQLLGNTHRDTLGTLHLLGDCYNRYGDLESAEQAFAGCLEGRKAVLGAQDSEIIATSVSLLTVYESRTKYAEAESIGKEVLRWEDPSFGDRSNVQMRSRIARACFRQGKFEEGERLLKECLGKAN